MAGLAMHEAALALLLLVPSPSPSCGGGREAEQNGVRQVSKKGQARTLLRFVRRAFSMNVPLQESHEKPLPTWLLHATCRILMTSNTLLPTHTHTISYTYIYMNTTCRILMNVPLQESLEDTPTHTHTIYTM